MPVYATVEEIHKLKKLNPPKISVNCSYWRGRGGWHVPPGPLPESTLAAV